MQQLDRRKLSESLLDILLVPLEEDPARHLVQLTVHEVDPPAHRAERRVGLPFEIDVPALLAALQLPHMLAVLGTRHGPYSTGFRAARQPAGLAARVTFSSHDMSCLRGATLLDSAVLPQVWGRHRDDWRDRLAGGPSLGPRGRCPRRARRCGRHALAFSAHTRR